MRDWTSEQWSAWAQVVAALGTVAAAVIAYFTARQSRAAARDSAEAAQTARRALALHFTPFGSYSLWGNEGEVPTLRFAWAGAPPDKCTVEWKADGTRHRADGVAGPISLTGTVVERLREPVGDGWSAPFVACECLTVTVVDQDRRTWRAGVCGTPLPPHYSDDRLALYPGMASAALDFELA